MPHAPKKALKIRRALKTAARLPTRRNHSSPAPGEQPVVFLRVQVLGCQGLSVRGKSGNCDPFVVVSLLNTRHHTPTSKRTPNPTFSPKDATFDFPIYLSLADRLGTVEVVVWDRETMITKEYLGEVALGLGDWFGERDIEGLGVNGLLGPSGYGFGDDGNKVSFDRIHSTSILVFSLRLHFHSIS
ncbi:C2-domain-containing protein [Hygrophoropsis aurantiaca]|uniref:C2-domain-containing protein n=1 Tax=Hygrophoropsis aurantiaca TaxID=72124 RepID=A0ACB8A577_9AGAM|nr:C2-domain-containing protein [Hygrophoropsis aurantiaca]